MCCCSHPPHTPSMQVTDDAPGRNPIFDHPFNLLTRFAQCSCMRNNVCLQKRLLFRLPNCLYPPPVWIGFAQLAPCKKQLQQPVSLWCYPKVASLDIGCLKNGSPYQWIRYAFFYQTSAGAFPVIPALDAAYSD